MVWILLNNIIKRFCDITIALMAAIILSPVLLFCAIWIKRDSKGAIIFKQDRLTKNGKVFRMYKFRTMVCNAEKMGAGLFNYKDDPRVTRAGKFLREHSLDELPQLFNIIKGDMSIVGPRPCVVNELGDYDTLNQLFKKRFEVIAGLTGLAQIQGRNELPWNIKAEFDAKYIDLYKRWGIGLDFYIICKTFLSVFTHKDIYEKKMNDSISDEQSAELSYQEIIRMAHE